MLRKNWLLKTRHPFVTSAEVSLSLSQHSSCIFTDRKSVSFILKVYLFLLLLLLLKILLPTVVMLLLIAVRTRVDTTIHPARS